MIIGQFAVRVFDLPPTPSGLLPQRDSVDVRCLRCHDEVPFDQRAIIAHARQHEPAGADTGEGAGLPK